MIKSLSAMLAILAFAGPARAGTLYFDLQGINPDGKSTYKGRVSLTEVAVGTNGEKSGVVTWMVDRAAPVRGVVMSSREMPGRLSISFPSTPAPGVAIGQFADDGSVRVRWFIGGSAVGSEIWTRRRQGPG